MKKMTFTLDGDTVRGIERASDRLGIPKSQVVREAVRVYGEQLGRMSEVERDAKLATFREVMTALPERPRKDVEAEQRQLREARRGGGRRTRAEP